MKNQNSSRVSFIRARAIALRVVSFATAAAPAPGYSTPAPATSPATLPPLRSVHVWRKGPAAAPSEALPPGFTPAPVAEFVPAIDPATDAEITPQAYRDALPEIFLADALHAMHCRPLQLAWHG